MRTSRLRWLLVVPVLVLVLWSGCGGTTVDGGLDPTGGTICLPDRTVCLEVPPGGLADYESFRIAPMSGEIPGGALSPGYDISPTGSTRVTFLKPARVIFSLDLVQQDSVPNESLMRIYTWTEGATNDGWQPLASSFVDRVRNEISGEIDHLSPFIVLRADRLPDGGIPMEGDAGMKEDSGVIEIPPIPDAGQPDAGRPDAGRPDAGQPDAGQPDAGQPDAGQPDAGQPDAGQPDAGQPDAGQPDAGQPDAGQPDAGQPDAGQPDAGQPDAGQPDAGADAGDTDAG
ncbi:MAG: hypothetical protein IT380_04385 [Myxococcales bacterium]|nr:hypothetical protein [Myxococcales bacterium]